MSRIRRGWALTKKSWSLLRSHPGLLRFPLYGAAASILATLVVVGPGPVPDRRQQHRPRRGPAGGRPLPAHAGRALLQRRPRGRGRHDLPRAGGVGGRRPGRLPRALRRDRRLGGRLNRGGIVLSLLEDQGGIAGAIFGRVLDIGWSLITFLAVPVIALEGTGPFETLKRSASLFRDRWGQQVTGNLAIGGAVRCSGCSPGSP